MHAFDYDFFNIRQRLISSNAIERLPGRNVFVGTIQQGRTRSWAAAGGDACTLNQPSRSVLLPDSRAASAVGIKEPRHNLPTRRLAADDLRSAGQLAGFAVDGDFGAE